MKTSNVESTPSRPSGRVDEAMSKVVVGVERTRGTQVVGRTGKANLEGGSPPPQQSLMRDGNKTGIQGYFNVAPHASCQ